MQPPTPPSRPFRRPAPGPRSWGPRSWGPRSWIIVLTLLCFAAALVGTLRSRRTILLVPRDGAEWIVPPEPLRLGTHPDLPQQVSFCTTATIPAGSHPAVLLMRALRDVSMRVDGQLLYDSGNRGDGWLQWHRIRLPLDALHPGPHAFRLEVRDRYGPCAVAASCPELHLFTSSQWTVQRPAAAPEHAATVEQIIQRGMGVGSPSVVAGLQRFWRQIAATFLAGCLLIGWESRLRLPLRWRMRHAGWVRWGGLLAWVVLGVHNLSRMGVALGYDFQMHLDYIHAIASGRLPGVGEGQETFNAPLQYLICRGLYRSLRPFTSEQRCVILLRLVPLICGAGLVEICYRTAREVFPRQPARCAVATAVGGLLPANLYMAYGLSGGLMSARLGCLAVLYGIRLLGQSATTAATDEAPSHEHGAVRWSLILLCAISLGLAVLAKVSALTWLPWLCLAVVIHGKNERGAASGIAAGIMFLLVVAAICGWWFVRLYSSPTRTLPTMYDPVGRHWWQDPGYEIPSQFFEFGQVFLHPMYSGSHSLLDSVYSTLWADAFMSCGSEWNLSLEAAGVGLAIVPALLILLGLCISIRRGLLTDRPLLRSWPAPDMRLPIAGILSFAAALLLAYLVTPIYGMGKWTYMSGTTSSLGVCAAVGFAALDRWRLVRMVLGALLICWVAVTCTTYWMG